MRRRQILKNVGAASVASVGAAGIVAGESDQQIAGVVANVNGERREFTPEEFDAHPETPALEDVTTNSCSYECKECCDVCCPGELCAWGYTCGSCDRYPDC